MLGARLRTLERRGAGALLTTLTDDVTSVTWAVQCLPQFAMHAAVVCGCAIYLATLSWQLFIALAIVSLASAAVYKVLYDRAFVRIDAARVARAKLLELFRAVTAGTRELMQNRARREDFLERELRPAAEDYREQNYAGARGYALADAWVQIVYYLLVGIVLFAAPSVLNVTGETLTAYVFAMLYLMTPIWGIVGTFPAVARGQVALARIEEIGISLDGEVERSAAVESQPTLAAGQSLVELRGAEFAYDAQVESGFKLGPLSFALRPGELVFIVGGNGSGKSTFVKLLVGLYELSAGSRWLGAHRVDEQSLARYREQFSVIFSDPFVFAGLHGLNDANVTQRATAYLAQLQIAHRVQIEQHRFSTTELSSGERKRLALIVAYLEDRPICVFDEWAADQDPEYKRIFYEMLLPELRARGKAVVVITHDDRYFHHGDRVIKLDEGRIVSAIDATRAAAS
jgi:putative ATP-binding cassette transporter